jgi:hypothetical protein
MPSILAVWACRATDNFVPFVEITSLDTRLKVIGLLTLHPHEFASYLGIPIDVSAN